MASSPSRSPSLPPSLPHEPKPKKHCIRPICRATQTHQWCTSPDGRATLCHRCYALYLDHKLPLFQHPQTHRLSLLPYPRWRPVRVTGFALHPPSAHRPHPRRPRRNAAKPLVHPLTDAPADQALLRMIHVPPNVAPRRRHANFPRSHTPTFSHTLHDVDNAPRHTPHHSHTDPASASPASHPATSDDPPFLLDRVSRARRRRCGPRVEREMQRDRHHLRMEGSRDTDTDDDAKGHDEDGDDDDDDADGGWLSVPRPSRRVATTPDNDTDAPRVGLKRRAPHPPTPRLSVTDRLFHDAVGRYAAQPNANPSSTCAPPGKCRRGEASVPRSGRMSRRRLGNVSEAREREARGSEGGFGRCTTPPRGPLASFSGEHGTPPREVVESFARRPEGQPRKHTQQGLPRENGPLVPVKAELDGDIRRLRISPDASYSSFVSQLRALFAQRAGLKLKYKDEEGDLVTVANERDMNEMFFMVREHDLSPLRIHVIVYHAAGQ